MNMLKYILVFFVMSLSISKIYAYQAPSEPLFKLLRPSYTNINFNNELKDTKDHNIMIYSNFYGGAGVGIGDINNDGLSDIYFAGNLVGDKIYLNKGDLIFEDITESAGIIDNGAWSSGVIMADVDKDGWLDIYVTSELYDDKKELRKNKLYINNQDNSFTDRAAEYNIDNSERTRHATFLDYDNDGDLDLFLLNQPPNPGDYSKFYRTELLLEEYRPVLYKNENGKFIDVTLEAGFNETGFPNSVTASDLNGDGWTDLFVANDFWVGDWYYINNGDGTFTNKALDKFSHTSFSSMGVDASDINNDGKLDIGVVDMVAEDNYRAKANMSGMNPMAFKKVVDDGGHYQYMFNMLHLNKGDGYFSDIAQLAGIASTDWSWSILMADLDNDGWKDIHITNGLMRDIRNKDAAKTLPDYLEAALHEFMQQNSNPENVSIWDIVDIDKALDLVPSERLSNYVFKNNGDFTFSKKVEDWGFQQKTFSNGAAYADLDNDGDIDIIENNINDFASVYQNLSSDKSLNNFLRIIPVADQEGSLIDGVKIHLRNAESEQYFEITGVRGMYSTSEKIAHFGIGKLEVVDEVVVKWRDGSENKFTNIIANQVLKAKYSDAEKLTSEKNQNSKETFFENVPGVIDYQHVENDFDDYKTQVLLPHKMSTFGPCISKGDVNSDGREDVFIGGSATKKARLFIQEINGTYRILDNPSISRDSIHEDLGSLFFDADGDGDLDLYVISGGNEFKPGSNKYFDRLYMNDGNGLFTASINALPKLSSSGSKVIAADYDKDGDQDLFIGGRHTVWSYPEPTSSYILRNDNGIFVDVSPDIAADLLNIGMVNDAKWFDHNGDGWMDLVVVGEWMPITIFENFEGKFSKQSNEGLEQSAGWWFSVETADMDGDGDDDIIAGNLGLNYKYKASKDEPFGVYYYDFDENSKKDIVLTYYNFGIQYPLRGKQCSSEQVPELKEKFDTYDLFASSDVSDIYGEHELESSLHYDAYTFASSYFENKGDGVFEAIPLPVEAQFSSVNDFVIDDFNADGYPDILLAGNLYKAEVETARNDAGHGLMLSGDGKGGFLAVDRSKSGFFVPYDVKSMEIVTIKGEKFVLVASNNDVLQTFKVNVLKQ